MGIKGVNLRPEDAFQPGRFLAALFEHLGLTDDGRVVLRILRRSIDARARNVVVKFKVDVIPADQAPWHAPDRQYRNVRTARRAIIVGAGPAGLFAALRLIELGIKPILVERGKDVRARRKDLAAINKEQVVNPESNYCFGEGGAGTYSDGKLYTRSKKRGDVQRILEILTAHGAPEEILFDAHPHIGTNKLPNVVAQLRETILTAGGEIHFETKMADVSLNGDAMQGIVTRNGDRLEAAAVLLSAGHSARDVFQLLDRRQIQIEAKPFALGVRIEHPQALIDRIQYHCGDSRGEFLPASSYAVVQQAIVKGTSRGVFSFCMCPGGFMVPAATAPGEVVINGMSPSRRNSKYANSGIVVAVEEKDFMEFAEFGPLAGMEFQAAIERKACKAAGGRQQAPAQRLIDFMENRISTTLPDSSYQPGLAAADFRDVLPEFIIESLRQGFRAFGEKMKGYLTNEAVMVGVESRTSSPVRIPRDASTLQHPQIKGLYPCGEGAGYAGGIVSAAMDGERCAEAIARQFGVAVDKPANQ